MENYTLGKWQQKQTNKETGVAILIANKIDFPAKKDNKRKNEDNPSSRHSMC